jgi:hypothetical protein
VIPVKTPTQKGLVVHGLLFEIGDVVDSKGNKPGIGSVMLLMLLLEMLMVFVDAAVGGPDVDARSIYVGNVTTIRCHISVELSQSLLYYNVTTG